MNNKIYKKISLLIVSFVLCFLLTSCKKETTVTLHLFDNEIYIFDATTTETFNLPTIKNRDGYIFKGWYDNPSFDGEPIESIKVVEGINIYACWEEIKEYNIIYVNLLNGTEEQSYEYLYYMGYDFQFLEEEPFEYKSRKIIGYSFIPNGPVNVVDSITDEQVKHYSDDYGKLKLYVVWGGPYEIEYLSTSGVYLDKFAMRIDYYTDFYNFIITQEGGKEDMEKNGIFNAHDFVELATDWNGGGTTEMRGIGNIAAKYYLSIDIGGSVENQPTTHFIGYCYQNNKWVDLIDFLIVFFAYWRTDEGYTGGPADPDNLGNDFFASSWASLVDTAKMFYFTSNTLTTKYPWFTTTRSPRVHEALENVPGCLNLNNLPKTLENEIITLPNLQMKGYTFMGWFNNDEGIGNPITTLNPSNIKSEITIYAVWKKQ